MSHPRPEFEIQLPRDASEIPPCGYCGKDFYGEQIPVFEARSVFLHNPSLSTDSSKGAVENDGLADQSRELKNSDHHQIFCELGELPLYLYVLVGLICGALMFWGGVLVADNHYFWKRACGLFLFLGGFGGTVSIGSAILLGNPLVIWGLADG